MELEHDAGAGKRTSDTLLQREVVGVQRELGELGELEEVWDMGDMGDMIEQLREIEVMEKAEEEWRMQRELWKLEKEMGKLRVQRELGDQEEVGGKLRELVEQREKLREKQRELRERYRLQWEMREKQMKLREKQRELREEQRELRDQEEVGGKLRELVEQREKLREEQWELRDQEEVREKLREQYRLQWEMRENQMKLREEQRELRKKRVYLRNRTPLVQAVRPEKQLSADRWLPVVRAQGCTPRPLPLVAQGPELGSPGASRRTFPIRKRHIVVAAPVEAQCGSMDPETFTPSGVRRPAEEEPWGPSISELPVGALLFPAANTLPVFSLPRLPSMNLPAPRRMLRSSSSGCFPRPTRTAPAERTPLPRAQSLPALRLDTSFEEFTPDVAGDDGGGGGGGYSYSFRCPRPGLYRCSATGLLFQMRGAGDVVYGTVPWDRRLLARHRKKPAGPLFDVACAEQRSVRQLHLPHCEIRSTGGCRFLSVAHVTGEGVELLGPRRVTETHVVVDVSGFSAFGNVKDEDSPPVPVRALVLLFYRPDPDPDPDPDHPQSLINVLLLPRNVSLRDVLRTRRTLTGEERYLETSPHCKLLQDQPYALSTRPEDASVLVQPTEADFDGDNYDNFFPAFQVILSRAVRHVKLVLRDGGSSSLSVWERQVCLSSAGGTRWSGPGPPTGLPSPERLLDARSGFVDGVSGPVLESLLDRLLESKVLTDAERESVHETRKQRDRARLVVDTVRRKGEAASSEMIAVLREVDPFLCEHLGLM